MAFSVSLARVFDVTSPVAYFINFGSKKESGGAIMANTTISDSAGAENLLAENDVDTIKLGMVDIDGLWRGKRVTVDYFVNSIIPKGVHIADILFGWDISDEPVEGLTYTGWHTAYPDIFMIPDLSTLAVVPWEERTASVVCDVVNQQGETISISPRQVLKNALGALPDEVAAINIGYELEFFLLRETLQTLREKNFTNLQPIMDGSRTYSLYRGTATEFIIGEIRRKMNEYGIVVDCSNSEHGAGQFEVNLRYCEALKAADNAVVFKHGIKELSAQRDLVATFMAKLTPEYAGNSGHVHQSAINANGGNIFADGKGGLSDLARYYVAGVLKCLPAIVALFWPNLNSYKRTVEGSWTGLNATWGIENRTTALRAVVGSDSATRVENRLPGADACPHLVIASCVAAGAHGIREKLECPEPRTGNAYLLSDDDAPRLPKSLDAALEAMRRSEIVREVLGSDFVDHYIGMREWELKQAQHAVTDWERRRYLEMV